VLLHYHAAGVYRLHLRLSKLVHWRWLTVTLLLLLLLGRCIVHLLWVVEVLHVLLLLLWRRDHNRGHRCRGHHLLRSLLDHVLLLLRLLLLLLLLLRLLLRLATVDAPSVRDDRTVRIHGLLSSVHRTRLTHEHCALAYEPEQKAE